MLSLIHFLLHPVYNLQQSTSVSGLNTDPADFTQLDSVPLIFTPTESIGDTVCTNITINDDPVTEDDEVFKVILESCECDPVNIFPNSTKEIIIINNDGKSIKIELEPIVLIILCSK